MFHRLSIPRHVSQPTNFPPRVISLLPPDVRGKNISVFGGWFHIAQKICDPWFFLLIFNYPRHSPNIFYSCSLKYNIYVSTLRFSWIYLFNYLFVSTGYHWHLRRWSTRINPLNMWAVVQMSMNSSCWNVYWDCTSTNFHLNTEALQISIYAV